MARWIGPGPEYAHIGYVLDAVVVWKDRCFLKDGSVFTDESLWTPANVEELEQLVKAMDRKMGDIKDNEWEIRIWEQLKEKLTDVRPELIHLAAEAFWFTSLYPDTREPKWKRGRFNELWEMAQANPIAQSRKHLIDDDRVLRGVAVVHPRHWWLYIPFPYLLRMVRLWKTEPPGVDLEPPWGFIRWLNTTVEFNPKAPTKMPMRHAIPYLLFPDYVERVQSSTDKRKIIAAFGKPEDKVKTDDEVIYEIREHLEKERGTKELDFYHPPLAEEWPRSEKDEPEDEPEPENALNVILYGPPGTGKTYETAQRCVELCDGEAKPSEIRSRYRELVEAGRIEFITFHQSYGYEEFVEGLRPETGSDAGIRLVATDGVLKRIARRARENEGEAHVLVIDEINRANVSKVMGELITLLEEDKRQNAENEVAVTLPHSGERFTLPANLHLLGTMNTADRSIALLDTALRRRFQFVELAPAPALLEAAAEATGVALPAVLQAMNDRLEWLLDRDHLIGHAWFMAARTKADVDEVMRRKIIPLLAEYFYEDWGKVRAVLGGGDDFVRGERLKPPPNLADDGYEEERRRWGVVPHEFADGAYDRLVGGRSADDAE